MTLPGDAEASPGPALLRDGQKRPRDASKAGTLVGGTTISVASLAVMMPWPLLGIMLTRSLFDGQAEAFLLFGGVTLLPLMVIALFGSISERALIAIFMLVWLAAAVLPGLWLRRRLRSWSALGVLLGVQSAFSLAQAAMGALMIIGKNV
ncbi:MAG TPA: hypothetical protein PKC43_13800 [Phycisphaerales bacterium]|nr:hypothetical protein [Phycisphaerales bacterium]HMP38507.1 hypothetical protein [Phycisphaerales bacterium]